MKQLWASSNHMSNELKGIQYKIYIKPQEDNTNIPSALCYAINRNVKQVLKNLFWSVVKLSVSVFFYGVCLMPSRMFDYYTMFLLNGGMSLWNFMRWNILHPEEEP